MSSNVLRDGASREGPKVTPRAAAALAPPTARPALTHARRVHVSWSPSVCPSAMVRNPGRTGISVRRNHCRRSRHKPRVRTVRIRVSEYERPEGRPSRSPGPLSHETPEHQEHPQPLEERQEEQEGPDPTDGRAPDEDAVEEDLKREEGPELPHGIVRGTVEREETLPPPDHEGDDRRHLEDEPKKQGRDHPETHGRRPDAERPLRAPVGGRRWRVEGGRDT